MKTMYKTITYAILLSLLVAAPAWALKGNLGYTGTDRTEAMVLNVSHELGSWYFNAEGLYGVTDGIATKNQGYLNVIYDHKFSNRWSVAGGNKGGFNAMRNIPFENFLGFGPKYYLYKSDHKTDHTKLSMSVWYLSQYTEYSDKDNEFVHRMSYRPKFSYRKGVHEVKAVFFYQPSLNEPDNYFTIGEASYDMYITKTQTVGLRYRDEYRSMADVKHEWIRYATWGFEF